jgi:cytidylate kinase
MSYHALAIDGPAGAGKSTIAKRLADRLDFTYIDTGAMYRATTYKAISLEVDLSDPDSFEFLDDTEFIFNNGELYMDGVNMTRLNRSKEVSDQVSLVSSHIPVRNKLVALQQAISKDNHVVMDGRDIGTVVLTHAELKIFLTASVHVRAMRRHEELKNNGRDITVEALEEEIKKRDLYDSSRAYNPLKKADDAIEIDTSDQTIDQVVDLIYNKYIDIIEGEL